MNNHILKINHIWAWILPVCLLLLWTGCEDKKADYIYLSSSSFTFSPEGSGILGRQALRLSHGLFVGRGDRWVDAPAFDSAEAWRQSLVSPGCRQGRPLYACPPRVSWPARVHRNDEQVRHSQRRQGSDHSVIYRSLPARDW